MFDDAPAMELEPALEGARVRGVRQPDESTLVLETYRAGVGGAFWMASLDADCARFGRVFQSSGRGGPPPLFCQWLRTRLVGGRIVRLRRPRDQVLAIVIETREAMFHLVLELNRRESNLLLLDNDGLLLTAMRRPSLPGRPLTAGSPYQPPPRMHKFHGPLPFEDRLPATDGEQARRLAARWVEAGAAAELAGMRNPALKQLRREIKRLNRRLGKLEADLTETANAALWHRRGELLQIHRHLLGTGQESVSVPDVFQPEQPMVAIPLHPRAGPGENIERCFKRFRKLRDGHAHVERRLAETRAELDLREKWLGSVETAENPDRLRGMAAELPASAGRLRTVLLGGKLSTGGLSGRDGGKGPQSGAAGRQPMRRISADGFTIIVGRSGEENDRVTFRLSKGRDWWFHAQGTPGSHVIVSNPTGLALPPVTLREAAWLAAYYSKGRERGRVDVDYTQRKHVRKLKGAPPGTVTIAHNRTILVDLNEGEAGAVLKRVEESGGANRQA
ncbi:MAG: NFACT RNA binding domain-containing protein [bacterium]